MCKEKNIHTLLFGGKNKIKVLVNSGMGTMGRKSLLVSFRYWTQGYRVLRRDIHNALLHERGESHSTKLCSNEYFLLNQQMFRGVANLGGRYLSSQIRSAHSHPPQRFLWYSCYILLGCCNILQFVTKTRRKLMQLCGWTIFHFFVLLVASFTVIICSVKKSILRNFLSSFLFFLLLWFLL